MTDMAANRLFHGDGDPGEGRIDPESRINDGAALRRGVENLARMAAELDLSELLAAEIALARELSRRRSLGIKGVHELRMAISGIRATIVQERAARRDEDDDPPEPELEMDPAELARKRARLADLLKPKSGDINRASRDGLGHGEGR